MRMAVRFEEKLLALLRGGEAMNLICLPNIRLCSYVVKSTSVLGMKGWGTVTLILAMLSFFISPYSHPSLRELLLKTLGQKRHIPKCPKTA